jgi:hypothetical protein
MQFSEAGLAIPTSLAGFVTGLQPANSHTTTTPQQSICNNFVIESFFFYNLFQQCFLAICFFVRWATPPLLHRSAFPIRGCRRFDRHF